MTLLTIPSGNVATATAATGFEVANSCRFNKADSAYLSKTFGTPTDQDKWTFSCWVKRGALGSNQDIFAVPTGTSGGYFHTGLQWNSSNQLEANVNYTGSVVGKKLPNALFRDTISWYHLVTVWDSDNASAGNRIKLYVNGVDQTSFATDTQPTSGLASQINQALAHRIGDGANGDLDGYLAEVVFVDGQALAPTSFGEYDEDSPTIWKPIDVSGLTFGNNGFYLDFEDSSALGNDVSGNNNDFAVTNLAAVDQSKDTPTNNFCTMNPLDNQIQGHTFSQGNNTIATTDASETYNTGTMGVTAGRWYFEAKLDDTTYSIRPTIGVVGAVSTNTGHYLGQQTASYGTSYNSDGNMRQTGSDVSYGNTYTAGDIVGVFLDITSNKIYFSKNGTIQNSGTGISITAVASTPIGAYFPAGGDRHGDDTIWHFNFGGGAFGATAISSAVADSNDVGAFEYSPNQGGASNFDSAAKNFLAICTKNLGSDGG